VNGVSDTQLELLQQSNLVYVDSTFIVVSSLFYQLITIFVPHADHAFPVLFALMTRKTTELYTAVFKKVHELIPTFHPTQVIADFEEAPAAAAVRSVFSDDDVTVSGRRWFHFAQAVVKCMKTVGLTDAYENEDSTHASRRSMLTGAATLAQQRH